MKDIKDLTPFELWQLEKGFKEIILEGPIVEEEDIKEEPRY